MDAACIAILGIILVRMAVSIDKRRTLILYKLTLAAVVVYTAFDLLTGLIRSGIVTSGAGMGNLSCFLKFASGGMAAYLWFLYSENIQESRIFRKEKNMLISVLPLMAYDLLMLISCLTGWVFSVSADGMITSGPAYILGLTLPFGYVMVTSANAGKLARDKENFVKKDEYKSLSVFGGVSVLTVILQLIAMDTPVSPAAVSIALLALHMQFQDRLVSIDPLTKMNNRNQMIRYLSGKMNRSPNDSKGLYLLIMDLDWFKSINDSFGHTEGDMALVRLSGALKRVCGEFNAFASRYGGDEFIIIYETENEISVEKLKSRVHDLLTESDRQVDSPYKLSVSIGCARWNRNMKHIPEFIAAADEDLYMVKQTRPDRLNVIAR